MIETITYILTLPCFCKSQLITEVLNSEMERSDTCNLPETMKYAGAEMNTNRLLQHYLMASQR